MKKIISAFLASMLLLGSIGGAAMAEGMTPGTYEAAAQGFHGDVKLSVTVDAEKITAIDILEHSETEGIARRRCRSWWKRCLRTRRSAWIPLRARR